MSHYYNKVDMIDNVYISKHICIYYLTINQKLGQSNPYVHQLCLCNALEAENCAIVYCSYSIAAVHYSTVGSS